MIYTIASIEDYASSQTLDFIKSGNKYNVELIDRKTKKVVRIRLNDKEKATSIYLKFVNFIIKGHYSFEQREKILKEYEESELKWNI